MSVGFWGPIKKSDILVFHQPNVIRSKLRIRKKMSVGNT